MKLARVDFRAKQRQVCRSGNGILLIHIKHMNIKVIAAALVDEFSMTGKPEHVRFQGMMMEKISKSVFKWRSCEFVPLFTCELRINDHGFFRKFKIIRKHSITKRDSRHFSFSEGNTQK